MTHGTTRPGKRPGFDCMTPPEESARGPPGKPTVTAASG